MNPVLLVFVENRFKVSARDDIETMSKLRATKGIKATITASYNKSKTILIPYKTARKILLKKCTKYGMASIKTVLY